MMKSMKMLAIAPLVLFVFAGVGDGQTNPEPPRFSLTIKAVKPEVTLGSDIDIAITTMNLTDNFLDFQFGNQGNVAIGYKYIVLDEKGVPVTKYGQRTKTLPNGGIWHIPSPPGKSMSGGIPPGDSSLQSSKISDLYKFDHPGKYTIQVSRAEESSPTPVYSNIITITVVDADSAPDAAK